MVHTCFVANALTPSCKVECFPDSQLGLMQVILIHIRCSVSCLELVKALAIVCDGSCHLQGQPLFKQQVKTLEENLQ